MGKGKSGKKGGSAGSAPQAKKSQEVVAVGGQGAAKSGPETRAAARRGGVGGKEPPPTAAQDVGKVEAPVSRREWLEVVTRTVTQCNLRNAPQQAPLSRAEKMVLRSHHAYVPRSASAGKGRSRCIVFDGVPASWGSADLGRAVEAGLRRSFPRDKQDSVPPKVWFEHQALKRGGHRLRFEDAALARRFLGPMEGDATGKTLAVVEFDARGRPNTSFPTGSGG